jgi:hypothetical protein
VALAKSSHWGWKVLVHSSRRRPSNPAITD